jgi:ATP-binding cassette subfamily C protein CydC
MKSAPRLVLQLGLAALLGAATELAGLGLLASATWLIVTAAGQPPLAALTVAIVAVRALAIGKGLGRYAERLSGHDAALRVLVRLRTRAYAAVSRAGHTGDVLSRLLSDVDGVQDLLIRCAIPAGVSTVVAAAALGGAGAVDPASLGPLAAGIAVTAIVVPALAYLLGRGAGGALAAARGALTVAGIDLTHGAADLLAYGAAPAALEQAGQRAAAVARLERRSATLAAGLAALAALLPGSTALATLLVARPTGGTAAVIGIVALGAVTAMTPLAPAAGRLAELGGGLRRIRELLAAAPVPTDPPATTPVDVRLRDAVVRRRLSGPPALDHVDLDLPAGRKVAVVGTSGAGKSTLLGVLSGLVPLTSGRMAITEPGSGVPQRRRIAGGLLSGAHVFHATLRANLTLGRPDLDVPTALVAAGFPDGIHRLDTVVGEDGAHLSGGERQRTLLARSLLADSPVLLLDEPTEGLDPTAADRLLGGILDAAGERSVLLVTHRLVGLWRFDEIVVLDEGRVVQRGQHAVLAAVPGWYREACNAQSLADHGYARLVGASPA